VQPAQTRPQAILQALGRQEARIIIRNANHTLEMPLQVGIEKDASGIDLISDPEEVLEARVHGCKLIGRGMVRFSPMGSAAVRDADLLELGEEG
jgi:hypothetical protein